MLLFDFFGFKNHDCGVCICLAEILSESLYEGMLKGESFDFLLSIAHLSLIL